MFFQRCQRLRAKTKDLLEHKRRVWDTVSLRVSQPCLLTGVGVYSPQGDASTIHCDARPIEDNLRPLDVATKLDSETNSDNTEITIFSKVRNLSLV